MTKKKVEIYDTTLRDGAQTHGISFSVADKLKITQLLDELGVKYIEGGWPGANPKDIEFFEEAQGLALKQAKLVAFGSTRRLDSPDCSSDHILQSLLKAKTDIVTIVGKTWDLHVEIALRTTLENNLQLISESISYLKKQNKQVIFDAEHFFDAYKHNPGYTFEVLEAASQADRIVLCDTNGGSLPSQISSTIHEVTAKLPNLKLGIHTHNDSGLALANSLAAVETGVCQIQGTINGYGERCGNADLISVIANLELKMNTQTLPDPTHLRKLTHISHAVEEIVNINLSSQHPFTGRFAFTHKGGLHVSAVRREPRTYEHIEPEIIGNYSRVLVSEQAGLSNILEFAQNRDIDLEPAPKDSANAILKEIKAKEHLGYQYDQASASLVLLYLEVLGSKPNYFDIIDFRTLSSLDDLSEATIQLATSSEKRFHTVSLGVGPGHALDRALREALIDQYQIVKDFKLIDFKVRVVDSTDGTAAKTRVNTEMSHNGHKWNTVGVNVNIIQAIFESLSESIQYGLYRARVMPIED